MGDEEEAAPAMEGEEAPAEEAAETTEEKRASNAGIAASRGSRKSATPSARGGGGGGEGVQSYICLEDVINLQVVTAIIAGEILHFCWYSDFFPWGSWHTRSFTSALVPDTFIAIFLGLITSSYVPVTDHLAAANMSLFLSLVYTALEGTHTVWYPRNLGVFALHGLHKFLLLLTMSTVMMYVRSIVQSDEFPELMSFGGGGDEGDAAAVAQTEQDEETPAGEAPAEEGAEGGEEAAAEGGEEGGEGQEGEEAPAEE